MGSGGDDAINGKRGLRAQPSPALFDVLRNFYGMEDVDDATDLGGSSNLNLLGDIGPTPYVVRVYRPFVSATRLTDIQRVRHELVAGGVPCSSFVTTRDGEPWAWVDDRLIEVEHYVEHDACMNSWVLLEEDLPVLGRIHTLLQRVSVSIAGATPLFANHVEPGDTLGWTLRGTRRICEWAPLPGELRLAQLAEDLAYVVGDAERDVAPSLPRQLVHGDFWDNNMFFQDGRVVLVADFDFMGQRARIDDLALTLYFANFSLPQASSFDERVSQLRRLVDAYDTGLYVPLTVEERAALPLAMARQPLWGVGWWLAVLDDESRARQLAAELPAEVEWALSLVRDLEHWQIGFA